MFNDSIRFVFKMLFLFSLLIFIVPIKGCPNQSIPSYKNSSICYYLINTKTDFIDAEGICIGFGGHLTSVHDMFENLFLSEKSHSNFTSDDFWFGANNLEGNWSWMDNTPFDFLDWGKGEPKNISNCGAVRIQDGKWITDDCFNAKPFICKVYVLPILSTTTTIKPTPSPCSDPWIYYDKTKSCYKILNNLSWEDANNACFKDGGGHLASIHSLDENNFITNLIPFNPNDGCFHPDLAWFGLYILDKETSWNWIDNTPFNFSEWAPGQPSGRYNCGVLYGTGCGISYGKWGDGASDTILGFSVCKKPALS